MPFLRQLCPSSSTDAIPKVKYPVKWPIQRTGMAAVAVKNLLQSFCFTYPIKKFRLRRELSRTATDIFTRPVAARPSSLATFWWNRK